jgi:hypothetical protein
MRLRVIPANPKTPMQVAFRAMMKFLGQTWAGLAAPDKASWDTLAAAENYSPFNAFVSKNQSRWGSFTSPSKAYPAEETGTPPTLAMTSGTGGVRMATIEITTNVTGDGWGMFIYRKLGSAPTGT